MASNSGFKALLDRHTLHLDQQLVNLELKRRHSLHRIENEIR